MNLMDNSGALAGATGTFGITENFRSEGYRKRAEVAIALCHAIAECDRDDAVIILEAALWDLRAGAPGPIFAATWQEAKEWADFACRMERKAYLLACFQRLSETDRAAFLAHVTGCAHG